MWTYHSQTSTHSNYISESCFVSKDHRNTPAAGQSRAAEGDPANGTPILGLVARPPLVGTSPGTAVVPPHARTDAKREVGL